jgi:hypothetical protein
MRVLFHVAILGLIFTPLLAGAAGPYIGGSLQVNNPTGDFSGDEFEEEQGGARSAVGGEIDVGIRAASVSAYIGYRTGKHKAEGRYETPFGDFAVDGTWTMDRWVAGARFHLLPLPLSPFAGGGITIGKTNAETDGEFQGVVYTASEESKSSTGWFLEGGAILQVGKQLGLIGSIQYHQFDAEFENDFYDGKVQISFITLNAGLRLSLM